jgi:hypothetical protein
LGSRIERNYVFEIAGIFVLLILFHLVLVLPPVEVGLDPVQLRLLLQQAIPERARLFLSK